MRGQSIIETMKGSNLALGEGGLDNMGLLKDKSIDKDLFVVKLPQGDILLKNSVLESKPGCVNSSSNLVFPLSEGKIVNDTNPRAGRPW